MYLGNFSNKEDVLNEFDLDKNALDGVKILLAWYDGGNYEGEAFVLFERDGTLYEVNGGHCSCYGLDGQWDEEETTVEALKYRIKNGSLGHFFGLAVFDKKLLGVLYRWQRKQRKLKEQS